MKRWSSWWGIHMLLVLGMLATTAAGAAQDESAIDPELQKKTYLYEIVRYLYRWHLDETDIDPIIQKKNITFRIRMLRPELDPGDRSRFAEILIPELNIGVRVKRADYTIEELGVVVKNDTFKIISVSRTKPFDSQMQKFMQIKVYYDAMRDYLFKTRNEGRFPEGELLSKMRHAVRHKLKQMGREEAIKAATARPPVVHFAPLSTVANESWVFVEDVRLLIRCASDIDLENPAVWEHEDLTVDLYEIDKQTVVSLDEVAGSNAYMTRDQVGRTLYNCMILGKRVELEPLQ